MTRRRRPFPVQPRVANATETAGYIGVSMSKFAAMRRSHEFAVPTLPFGDYFDLRAVDDWLDNISGRGAPGAARDPWEEACHGTN